MRKSCIAVILVCVLTGPVFAYDIVVPAVQSCRTEILYPTTNRHDSSKLSVRGDNSAAKSWIKFDLTSVDLSTIRDATLRIALLDPKDNTCSLSAVNDDCVDTINWDDRSIHWTNAPGNDTASLTDLLSSATSFVATVDYSEGTGGVAGQQYFINVLPALQSDTDGIVQFVLHNAGGLTNFCTHDVPDKTFGGVLYTTEVLQPVLILTYPPLGADYPDPEDNAINIPTDLAALDWVNPDPNTPGQPIVCDVYLGTDPNRLTMDKVTLAADESTVALTQANFPRFVPLENYGTYYWYVDCHDTDKGLIEGEEWSFETNDNQTPVVDAGDDVVTWLLGDPAEATVSLTGSASDDGLPTPPSLTYLWERTAGPETAVINVADALATSVTFTEAGEYTFQLTVNDGDKPASDTLEVVIGTSPCDASHRLTGDPYNDADQNQDCLVDLADLTALIIDAWLACTDTLTNCGF